MNYFRVWVRIVSRWYKTDTLFVSYIEARKFAQNIANEQDFEAVKIVLYTNNN